MTDLPADPYADTGDLLADARGIGSVIFDGLLDALHSDGLFGLYPAVLALDRTDQERVALLMLDEILHGGKRLGYPPDHDPAQQREPDEGEHAAPRGRLLLAEVGYGVLHGGWPEAIRRLQASSGVEVQLMILDTLAGAWAALIEHRRSEEDWS